MPNEHANRVPNTIGDIQVSINGHTPNTEQVPAASTEPNRAMRFINEHAKPANAVLITATVLLAGVILAPLSLSAEHIMDWARASTGLNLTGKWPWVVFYSLDATAIVCVLMSLYCTLRGESGVIFRFIVWVLAGASAFANYRHSINDTPVNDSVWFFPGMALSAPFLLEVVLGVARKWIKQAEGRTSELMPSFGLARWIPGVGAFRETYGAWRVARLKELRTPSEAINEYRRLVAGKTEKRAKWKVLTYIQVEAEQALVPNTPTEDLFGTEEKDRTEQVPSTEHINTEKTEPVRSPKPVPVSPPTEDRTGTPEDKTEQGPNRTGTTARKPKTGTPQKDRDLKLIEQVRLELAKLGEPIQNTSGYQIRKITGCNYNAANRVLELIQKEAP